MPSDVQVIFVGGASRTGSTLLSLLLGSMPGHFAAGELRYIWLRGLLGNQLCGCGEPFRACPFWRDVIGKALGPIDELDERRLVALWHRSARPAPVMRARLGLADHEARTSRAEYVRVLSDLYRAIHEATGGDVIVDSSKYATDCELLARVPGVRVHAIHLVRDSRAVAYSWKRTKVRPEIHWRQQEMLHFSPVRASMHWNAMNAAMELVGRDVARYDLMRYEDLTCDPARTLTTVLPSGSGSRIAAALAGEQPSTAKNHTVSGNPMRFDRGPIRIRPDIEWISALGDADRRLVTALTFPLLLRYGYLGATRTSA
jgi:hypothetical protein